ncbi:hypothetical protein I6E91_18735 [Enterocloster clostridioformis]|uniref:hypothetical protein n=1 Tax=Enterocloster clostridioformis TaxID=1531 RepID=UPI001F46EA25|nr:hypothetical protein [Enterocloster clostridioformis]MCF2704091.1 hypothetical protein [Enterocloster clostridioformis]
MSNKSSDEINKVFLNELGKTKLLDFTFDQFWLVTALDRDTSIQNIVENMQDQYAGTIYILFWDDIEEILSYNANIVMQYYPEYCSKSQNYSSLVCLGFFSQIFSDYIDMMRFERNVAISYCDSIENCLDWVTNDNTKRVIQANLLGIREYLMGPLNLVSDFKQENEYYWCQTVEQNILSIQYSLDNSFIVYFRIGNKLGELEHLLNFSTNMTIIDRHVNELKQLINSLNLRENDRSVIWSHLEKLSDNNTKYYVPSNIYNDVCKMV